jgi:hypothetical protein
MAVPFLSRSGAGERFQEAAPVACAVEDGAHLIATCPVSIQAPMFQLNACAVPTRVRCPTDTCFHRPRAHCGGFSIGKGFMTASTAPVGSSRTLKRPMPGMSSGTTGIRAPSFLARAIVASTSSTAT